MSEFDLGHVVRVEMSNYTIQVEEDYADHPSILGHELQFDPPVIKSEFYSE
jgi:hypothetical protein